MKYGFLLLLLSMFLTNHANAQQSRTVSRAESAVTKNAFVKNYEDSLRICYDRLYNSPANPTVSPYERMPLLSPVLSYQYYKLFAPFTFYKGIVDRQLLLDGTKTTERDEIGSKITSDLLVDNAIMRVYLKRPDLVLNTATRLHNAAPETPTIPVVLKSDIGLTEKVVKKPVDPKNISTDVVVLKPNFWTFKGDYYLQFLQNYVSGNWYKGGESNYSMVGAVMLQLGYNNKQKVKWDNKLELKLGFITSKNDSLHSLKTSEDLIRYTGKLGLQASKKWYYTVQLVAYTQFLRGYRNNSNTVSSDFMSPLNTNLSLGMDYNVSWFKKRLTGSIHLAPLAYNFRYVGRLSVASRYSVKPNRHTLHDFGSEFTFDLLWKMSDAISWQTRLYGYTTYRRAEVEWENTFTFRFNKYISSKLFVYPRFDDGTARDGHHGYWQIKEFASIGFSYDF